MNKTDLINAIRLGRIELEAVWSGASQEMLVARPGPQADWSVKDLIAHLTFWEQSMLRYLPVILRGGTPQWQELDETNARVLAENDDRPLAEVLAAFQQSLEQVLRQVEALTDDDLERLYASLHNHALWTMIAGDTYEHYRDHIHDLRQWRVKAGLASPIE